MTNDAIDGVNYGSSTQPLYTAKKESSSQTQNSVFEKKSDIQKKYDEESLAYYKEAIADGILSIKEMAGMPVQLRALAQVYAMKQGFAEKNANNIVNELLKNIDASDMSDEEIYQLLNDLKERALKAELEYLKKEESKNVFGIDG